MVCMSSLLYRPCWIIQKSQNCLFLMIQIAKNEVFGHFLEFGVSDWLDIAYFNRTKCLHDLASVSLMLDHSRITKMPFWLNQRSKNEALGQILEFGASDWLDTSFSGSTKWSLWFVHVILCVRSFKSHKNATRGQQDAKGCNMPNYDTYGT